MDALGKVAALFVWSYFSFWTSIPGGVALGLTIVPVVITAIVAYFLGIVTIVVVGERVRAWLLKRFGAKMIGNPNSPVMRAWDRFGVIGLGLFAPILVGSHIGAAIMLALGAAPRRVLIWMSLGGVLWGVLIGAAVAIGLVAVGR